MKPSHSLNKDRTDHQNTYHFDQFEHHNKIKELNRLEKQATLVAEIERSAIKEIGLPDSGIFVDMGCGPGFVSAQIAKHFPKWHILGIDLSDDLLKVANSHTTHYPNLMFQKGSAYQTNLTDNSMDIVYARLLYQHLDQPKKAIAEALRILKPEGKLCILDVDDQLQLFYPELPTFATIQAAAQAAQKAQGGNRHIARQLPHLMESSGFSNIRCFAKSISSLDIGLDAFLEIVVSFKAQIIQEKGPELVKTLQKEIQALSSPPFGLACIPAVIGVKPSK